MSAKHPPPRLGRGLAALLGEAAEPSDAVEPAVRAIAIDRLAPGPFQPRGRLDDASLADLTDSIRARGILQPLLARPDPALPDRFQIIAGERRWWAARAAGLSEVPALVRDLADAEAMAAALVENLQRRDLNAIEEAEGYRRLVIDFGMSHEALGEAVGKSRSHVANTLRLLSLPPGVQADVRSGALSAGHARALLGHPDPESAARAVIAEGLNVRQAEALAKHKPPAPERASSPRERARDPDTEAMARRLSEQLGLRVDIAFDGGRGSVRIRYRTLDQLEGLIALLGGG